MIKTESKIVVMVERRQRSLSDSSSVHFWTGAIAGGCSAIVTAPLEVAKTRLQSAQYGTALPRTSCAQTASNVHIESTGRLCAVPYNLNNAYSRFSQLLITHPSLRGHKAVFYSQCTPLRNPLSSVVPLPVSRYPAFAQCLIDIIRTDGHRGLYRGLWATLCGVIPSCGIYFWSYNHAKDALRNNLICQNACLHLTSAFIAAFTQHTLTNPIWYIKTRVQLDSRLTLRHLWRTTALHSYWKGVTASYCGIPETMVKWMLYEHLKEALNLDSPQSGDNLRRLPYYMLAAGTSKLLATTLFYPHEVVRTRIRECASSHANGLWVTFKTVLHEGALYRGLAPHLISKVPNAACMFLVYEAGLALYNYY